MTAPRIQLADLPGVRVLADSLGFVESPRFAGGEVYFSDMNAVRAADLKGNVRLVAELPTPLVLGISPAPDGAVYAAAAFDRKIYRIAGGKYEVVVDLSAETSAPVNEFARRSDGSFLVGSMGFNPVTEGFGTPRAVPMFLVSPDSVIAETGPEVLFANGLVLSEDERTLCIVESLTRTVHRFSLGADGQILSDDPVILLEHREPDGMSLDVDGDMWWADMTNGAVVLSGEDGATKAVVEFPDPRTPCCLVFEDNGQANYAAAKAGIIGLTKTTAKELAR
ncbi:MULTISPECIES: SMP-30/gluconolactonase/LRE family protein [unclassified Streptomyces]|uniref:SMP-30/gluconolactonase/LRE family protein n=1 Tax=unclassified Streptomyces TaxID=2593676 RepID=UPI0036E0B6C6